MTDDDEVAQKIKAILKELDKLIEEKSWEESNFIRAIGKDIREIRDRFVQEVGPDANKNKMASHLRQRNVSRDNLKEIFIALYSSEGTNLYTWERIIQNLPRQVISRPIYAEQSAIQASIKSKEKKVNEAYLSIYVDRKDLLQIPQEKIPVDKLGQPLLTLKDKALRLDNINLFVHLSGTYQYINGRLIKNSP